MAIKEQAMLIFTDALNNNNKFYELILHDNDQVDTRWGRVSSAGQSKTVHGGKREFDSIIRAKISKGYERSEAVSLNISSEASSKQELAEVAKRDILGEQNKDNIELVKLMDRLSAINRHQIMAASNGNIKIDETGLVRTDLGIVLPDTINKARDILGNLNNYVITKDFNSSDYIKSLEAYLKLIPQKVPTKRGWHESFFAEQSAIVAQNSFLDQLESSIDLYQAKLADAKKAALENKDKPVIDQMFKTKLKLVTDTNIIKKIDKYYNESKNVRHMSANLRLKNVFEVQHEDWNNRFAEACLKIDNVQLLWHGTRAFNVLSIFKSGLIVPKSGGSYHITGRMFGDGLYFSDQSSKALNYSAGYWDGGPKDDNCYMFLAEVALGKQYVPAHSNDRRYPVPGYQSTFAKANKSGVLNNEMIVYDINQVNLKYLCEFSR